MILMIREMNSSARMFRLIICFIRPSRLPIQESMISRFCFCFSYACHQLELRTYYLPRISLSFESSLTFILFLSKEFMKSLCAVWHICNTLSQLVLVYSRLQLIVEIQPLVPFTCLFQIRFRVSLSYKVCMTLYWSINITK
jgi:hypothetical protein